jgi:N-acetylmuramoyl-L-alanine amidase
MRVWDWLIRRRLPEPSEISAEQLSMRIAGDYLAGEGVNYVHSLNYGDRFRAEPICIVMHYTGGASLSSSVSHLCNPHIRASAHLVIGRDGDVRQLVPFHTEAWHAGRSEWDGHDGLNPISIGIELDNPGELAEDRGHVETTFGRAVHLEDRERLTHQHGGTSWWHSFPRVQIERAEEACKLLVMRYPITAILGHDDVSPGRKRDPGPAYPIQSLRTRLGMV